MAIYKRGKTYWFSFIFNGERVQRTTKQKNRVAARQIEAAYKTQLAKGEVGLVERAPIPTFSVFATRFGEKMREFHQAKPKTLTYYMSGVKRLNEFFGTVSLDAVTTNLIAEYVTKRRAQKKKNGKLLKVASVNRELEVLRRMLRLAQEWEILGVIPKISRLPGEEARDRVVNHSEEAAYLTACCPLLRDVATILIDTGLRVDEALRLEWEHIHEDYIHIPRGKSPKAVRDVFVSTRVRELIRMRHETQKKPREGWVFPAATKSGRVESLKSQHRKALKLSKVRPFVLHSLRHTCLTRLGETGCDSFTLKKLAGHASVQVSEKYIHLSNERGVNAIAALEHYNLRKEQELATTTVQ
jgi:integrase